MTNAFVAPSITTYTRLNPSFRVYQVHPETFEVYDFDQYYTDLTEVDDLTKNHRNHGPVWRKLYNAREEYGNFGKAQSKGKFDGLPLRLDHGWWPEGAPLNGTFWSALADEMSVNPEKLTRFSINQSSGSKAAKVCRDDECREANVCYMRTGTSIQGRRCNSDYSTVAR